MLKKLICMSTFILFFGCAHQNHQLTKCQWSNGILIGHTFQIVSDTDIREYSFLKNNTVIATIGGREWEIWPAIKKVWVTGPILLWEINRDGKLLIKKNNGDIWFSYILKGKFEDKYFVIENGKDKIFKRK